jgi:ABC-2 type transport system permease protein
MSTLRKLILTELRLFLREPVGVFFTVAFPGILVTVVGKVWSKPDPALGGLRVIDLYITVAVTFVMCMLGLQFAPQALATYRERGMLRRMSTTPVHPAKLLVAQLTTNLLAALVSIALVLVIGRVVFGVALPKQVPGFLVALVLAAAAVFAIGLVIAALAPTGKAGGAIGGILFFPMMFFAGLWVPREVMSSTLRQISDLTPLGAGVQALRDAANGSWPHTGPLLVLTAYVVVFGVAAVRLFRWE